MWVADPLRVRACVPPSLSAVAHISDNNHKELIEQSPPNARTRIYYRNVVARQTALNELTEVTSEKHHCPAATSHHYTYTVCSHTCTAATAAAEHTVSALLSPSLSPSLPPSLSPSHPLSLRRHCR